MRDFAAVDKRGRRREHLRSVLAWSVCAIVSVGLHHLTLQALDASGFGMPGRHAAPPPVALDLFEPAAPAVRPPAPPAPHPPAPGPPAPPAPTPPSATNPAPSAATPSAPNAAARPHHPRVPHLPAATPADEQNPDQLTLHADTSEPYDPLHPQLRMNDWSSERFAAADRFLDATDAARAESLVPQTLRSPLEQIGPWNDWGGDAAIAAANDFFNEASDGIQLAINPDRPDLLRYVPVDAKVLAYLNLEAVAGGPHAEGVAALLRAIPDYQTMVGHVEAELLAHAAELYITSSDPADRAKTVVIIRHRMSDQEIAALVGRQIALSGGKADWTTLSARSAVTVDPEHLAATPWLYLFPEPGVVLVVHRSNLAPLVAALEGRSGTGNQPQLVYEIRHLVGVPEEQAAAQPPGPPTLFAVADAGSLGPHLRFVTHALAGADLGDFGGAYLRITGGPQLEVLGGLQLATPDQVPRWQDLMHHIEDGALAQTFGFTWAGRDDRVFFRFQLTDPVVSSSLGLFRAWADRYYASGAAPALPEADGPRNVLTSVVAGSATQDAGPAPLGPDGTLLKDPSDAGPGAAKDPDAGGADGGREAE